MLLDSADFVKLKCKFRSLGGALLKWAQIRLCPRHLVILNWILIKDKSELSIGIEEISSTKPLKVRDPIASKRKNSKSWSMGVSQVFRKSKATKSRWITFEDENQGVDKVSISLPEMIKGWLGRRELLLTTLPSRLINQLLRHKSRPPWDYITLHWVKGMGYDKKRQGFPLERTRKLVQT